MFIHVTFEDRSQPYIEYCESEKEIEEKKAKWEKHYILTEINCTASPYGANHYYTAKIKR